MCFFEMVNNMDNLKVLFYHLFICISDFVYECGTYITVITNELKIKFLPNDSLTM
jgi:hypothetical protein